MKKMVLVLLVVSEGLLGAWCWSYSLYAETMRRAVAGFECGDNLAAIAHLDDFRQTWRGALYKELPGLRQFYDRIIYAEATARMGLGEDQRASELFMQVVSSQQTEVSNGSFYNHALLNIQKGDFISARTELSKALVIMPSDLDSRYNLEILLGKEMEQLAKESEPGREPLSSSAESQKGSQHFRNELWRFKTPEDSGGGGAQIRRRYL